MIFWTIWDNLSLESFQGRKKTLYFEIYAIKETISNFIEKSRFEQRGSHTDSLKNIKPQIGLYNVYGRIIRKQLRGVQVLTKYLATEIRGMAGRMQT